VTECIPIAIAGRLHVIQGVRESWDAVRAVATHVERVGRQDAANPGALSVYVVQPGGRHYLVEEEGGQYEGDLVRAAYP
jgi:hypothetical protein